MAADREAAWSGRSVSLALRRVDGVPVAFLEGELDVESVPEVERFLRRNLGPLFFKRHLVLDLERVRFIDSSFVTLLVSLVHRFQAERTELVLVRPVGAVRRVLALVGLPNLVPVYDAVDDAVAALESRVAPLIPPPFEAGIAAARAARA